MSFFDWESFLRQWSQAALESMHRDQLAQLPQTVIESGWLGYPGATDKQISQAEARLQVRFPPSYREFLNVTNGWRQTTSFIHKLWSTEGIERFAARHQKWIEAYLGQRETTHFDHELTHPELDQFWQSPQISDEDYFIYGADQDCSKLRVEYLRSAIEISDVGASAIYLLNPQVVTAEGEWEAWFFCDLLPGADRYPSFRAMMEAEYQNFLDLRDVLSEPNQSFSVAPIQNLPEQSGQETLAIFPEDIQPLDDVHVEPAVADLGSAIAPKPDEIWSLFKRLTIEFHRKQVGDRTHYRTVARGGALNPAQTWSGVGEQKLRLWIRQQLAAELPTSSATDRSPAPTTTDTPSPPDVLKLKIDQLKIWQPSQPVTQGMLYQARLKQAQQLLTDSLIGQKPFSLEVVFKLVGQMVHKPSAKPVTYKAHFYAHNRMTGKCVSLGETEPSTLRSDTSTYTAKLDETTLEPGLYRLQVLTTLQGATVTPAYFEMPLVQVV